MRRLASAGKPTSGSCSSRPVRRVSLVDITSIIIITIIITIATPNSSHHHKRRIAHSATHVAPISDNLVSIAVASSGHSTGSRSVAIIECSIEETLSSGCLLYTSDAADDM
eukprot:8146733-Alexandrium_andersonii.AAC.1